MCLRFGLERMLFQCFRTQVQIADAGGLFFPIFADPGLPALPGSSVSPGKRQRRNIGITGFNAIVGILGQYPDEAGGKRWPGHAIEYISFDLLPVFQRQRHIAAIVERFFQSDANIFFFSFQFVEYDDGVGL